MLFIWTVATLNIATISSAAHKCVTCAKNNDIWIYVHTGKLNTVSLKTKKVF